MTPGLDRKPMKCAKCSDGANSAAPRPRRYWASVPGATRPFPMRAGPSCARSPALAASGKRPVVHRSPMLRRLQVCPLARRARGRIWTGRGIHRTNLDRSGRRFGSHHRQLSRCTRADKTGAACHVHTRADSWVRSRPVAVRHNRRRLSPAATSVWNNATTANTGQGEMHEQFYKVKA